MQFFPKAAVSLRHLRLVRMVMRGRVGLGAPLRGASLSVKPSALLQRIAICHSCQICYLSRWIGSKKMAHDRLIEAIGRMERALGRLEAIDLSPSPNVGSDRELAQRHEALKSETRAAIGDISRLLADMES
jgi:hypothetical protein